MLDDLNVIAQKDPAGALGFAATQPEQLAADFGVSSHAFDVKFDNVVFAAMGGSALAADFATTYPKLKVPLVVCKGYDLPEFVDKKTLAICASYSGNTEETISALGQAGERAGAVVVISHGGKLADIAAERGYLHVQLPEAPQPRTGVFAAYRALLEILVAAKLVESSVITEVEALVEPLEKAVSQWMPSVPTNQNAAKQLAEKMVGKTLIAYGGPLTYPAAYKWKISANENAKNTAWSNYIPEFNHNEFIGWSSHPVEKPFAVVDLLSSYEHERVLRRFEVSDRLLSGRRPKSIEIWAEGDSVLEHLLYLILLGDFATTYLAILNGVNPTPVELVEKFKKELDY